MSNTRRAYVDTLYAGENISNYIQKDLESFSYTDPASGETDSFSMTLCDKDKSWREMWMPKKGDRLANLCHFQNWEEEGDDWELYSGSFQIDDITMSGKPYTMQIGGVSMPIDGAFQSKKRSKTWKKVTLRELAQEIADRAGVTLVYEAEDIEIAAAEQEKKTDCTFLREKTEEYGLAMKVFDSKIVIFDEAIYEKKEAVATFYEEDFQSWNFNTTTAGTYTGAKLSYSDPKTGKDHVVTVGGGDRILEINKSCDSEKDAERKAVAELNKENKKAVTMDVTIKAKEGIVSTVCVEIDGMGECSGIYYIDKVVTKISGKGASTQSLSMHRIGSRIEDASVKLQNQEKEEEGEGTEYTVQKGDTLWEIAEKLLENPLEYAKIYEKNKETIEVKAQEHGRKDSGHGHYIYAGTVLLIPAAEGGERIC